MNRKQLFEALRHPYAWPGGYPTFMLMSDGECLCMSCAKDNAALIARRTRDARDTSGWRAVGQEVNWEDSELHCAHCSVQIESAYA